MQMIMKWGWETLCKDPFIVLINLFVSFLPMKRRLKLTNVMSECEPRSGAVWKERDGKVINFLITYLTQTSKILHYFISAHPFPINRDRANLNYSIQMGHSINVGKLIYSSLMYIIRGITFCRFRRRLNSVSLG
ncbi:hypothetical protein IEQ34_019819 [Dendrobium chrysotoxum]|uniref:Maturase K n=1 Tax=Dendrobium chrysotoxum TaxID=161865 RepID=A0AAV7FSA8_DENCH|nr:hypothetical protein IEQ34_019819 [Dendrobium chrysotoxum]